MRDVFLFLSLSGKKEGISGSIARPCSRRITSRHLCSPLQDPVLYSGTIRELLDPFGHCTDAELRDCLERVHLTSTSNRAPDPVSPEQEEGSGEDVETSYDSDNSSGEATVVGPSHHRNNTTASTNVFDDLN